MSDEHPPHPPHRVFVGAPEAYDVLGGSHFSLLFLLGLRETHHVLDFGCGSLRSGRLLISFLESGHYYGIEPNKWLINGALKHELGKHFFKQKKPHFAHNDDFRLTGFGASFDFVHAHSIFTHAPAAMVDRFFGEAARVLTQAGMVVGTFIEGDEDYAGDSWAYPECIAYTRPRFRAFVEDNGLRFHPIGWRRIAQTNFVATRPEFDFAAHLEAIRCEFGTDLDERAGGAPKLETGATPDAP